MANSAYTSLQLALTTTGTSGAATLTNGVLNIPQYSGGGGGAVSSLTTTGTGAATLSSGVLNIPTPALSDYLLKAGDTMSGALAINVAPSSGLTITSTGDQARITLSGPSLSAKIQTSFSGGNLDFLVNNETQVRLRLGTTELGLYAASASAGTTIQQAPQIALRGRYWNGTSSIDSYFAIKNIITDTTPTAKLAFLAGSTEQASMDLAGAWIFSGGITATAFAGSHLMTNTKFSSGTGDVVQIIGTGSNNSILRFYDDATERGSLYSVNSSSDFVLRSQVKLVLVSNNSTTGQFAYWEGGAFYSTTAATTLGTDTNPWSKATLTSLKLATTSAPTIGQVWTATDTSGNGSWQTASGGGGTNYYALNKDAQSFTPANSNASQTFTLSGTELVKGVYLNGQRLLTSEYSLAGSTLTVTPAAGLTTTDNVLVDQVSNSTAAAGSAVQISDYTDYTSITDPAVPASGKLRVYAKTISGRIMPKVITPGGRDYPLQPSFFQNAITMISPSATTTLGTVGAGVTTVGTISHPAKTETYGFMANFVTAGTAAATAGTGSRDVQFHRGSTTGGANGFFVYERLAFPDASYNQTGAATGSKLFVGVTSVAFSALAPLDTSASSHIFGFSRRHTDTGAQDTNWQLWTGDGTTNTFVDTGMVFAPAKVYDFYVYCQPHPNNTTMYWRIDNITDGTTFEGSTSTTLPGTTTALRAGFQIYSVDAVARNVRMGRVYTETDR